MNVLILGGGGFLGQKLAHELGQRGSLAGRTIDRMVLADLTKPRMPDTELATDGIVCDISDPESVASAISRETDVIYLLAAVVSSHAEADLDAGLQANLFGVFNVLERCRALGHCPMVLFASSLAVFGGEVPDPVEDWTALNPQTSYGSQKAMGELLLNDYSRRGLVRGRGFRLPTIAVRPGKPNLAASSFMSSIIREPLNGETAICPVDRDFMHYYLSPRRCIDNFIKGAEWDQADLGLNCCMTMPGKQLSIGQMIDAMREVAGPEPEKLIRWESQPEIKRIVEGWRFDLRPRKALDLGLTADDSFTDNVHHYIEDYMPGAQA